VTPPTRTLPLVLAILAGLSAVVTGQEDRQKEISRIQAQIDELSKKLAELKQAAESGDEAAGKDASTLERWLEGLSWRQIGPANMGGRIVALAVIESNPSTFYVATASGGLLKTHNNGITFEHQFDREATVSIGDVCVAPSDPNIVWVGTGENNARNSVSYGDGVYKSTDGGKTWTNMGLKGSFQIGRIAIHPTNPDIVYVGALGRLYGPNEERGLFKTTDGGKSWEKILYVDDKTGVIDLRLNPANPDTILVATYQRKRDEFDQGDPEVKWGPGSGIHKSTDGGKTFRRLTQGLPTVAMGRIGLDYYRKDPNIAFAIIETEKIGTGPKPPEGAGNAYMGIQGEDREDKVQLTEVVPDGPAEKAGLKDGDTVTRFDGKPVKTYEELVDRIRARKAEEKVKVEVLREGKPVEVEVTLGQRPAGGPGGRSGDPDRPFSSGLGGQRENAQDRQGDEGFQTGGVFKTTDGGETWARINSLNPRPFYFSQIRVDPADDQYVYVLGISMYRSKDGGKTFRGDGGRGVHADHHALWIDPRDGRHMIVGCDGGIYATYDRMDNWDHYNHMALGQFYDVALDTTRDYRVYGGLQDNGTWGGPSRTRNGTGPINEDWISINGGDGFQCQVDPDDPDLVYATSQYGAMIRRHLKTGETARIRPAPEKDIRLRWNWDTPFVLAPQNARIFYCAANYVFRSLDRGNDLRRISPEITRTDKGSATALAVSPRDPDVIWVGTDDGALWVTRDGGREWVNVWDRLGLPGPRFVDTIEASRFADGRAYVAIDGHRNDDDACYLLATQDYGQTWTRLGRNVVDGWAHCLREDIQNENLLFAGTELAPWVSVDRGKTWRRLRGANLPTVAIQDFAIHPTAGEIVAATHGRSLWVLDISALRQITPEVITAGAFLFKPTPAVRWMSEPNRGRTNRRFAGENPAPGAAIYYSITARPEKLSLKIIDSEGKTVRELRAPRDPGLHRIAWDLTRAPEPRRREAGPPSGARPTPAPSAEEFLENVQRRATALRARPVPPGEYRLVLEADGKELTQTVRVEPDPGAPISIIVEQYGGEDKVLDEFEPEDEEEAAERPID
jgi:photosystem II stability/assembly factor-like uncharacterized protein